MHRTVIVARMLPDTAGKIAAVFTDADHHSGLPEVIGVHARSLFRFGDVYLHLVESDRPLDKAVTEHRHDPRFTRISEDLRPFVTPYDPTAWRGPADAMAHEFYRWERHG